MDRKRGWAGVWAGPGAVMALVGSMLIAGCESTTAVAVTTDVATSLSITVSGADPSQMAGDQLVLEVGDTISLAAVATNALGLAVPAGTVTWSSTNTAVADVDGSGLVSAVGAGTAEIRAASGDAVSSLTTVVKDSTAF